MTLVVQMHGLPGSGKSTVARALAPELGAVVIDKDVIKAALLRSGIAEAQAAAGAYETYFDLAAQIVGTGHSVILDNPVFWPRVEAKWRALAAEAGSPALMIECVCADTRELQRRLATRDAQESQPREPLDLRRHEGTIEIDCPRLTLDTLRPLAEIVAEAVAYVRSAEVPA
jgi:predicted kinase